MSKCCNCQRPLDAGDDTSGLCRYCKGVIPKYDAVAPRLNQLEKIEEEKEQRRLDELKRLQARNEELEAEVAKLEAGVNYYERIVAFIEDFEPRIVDDAREYIIKTTKEASHE